MKKSKNYQCLTSDFETWKKLLETIVLFYQEKEPFKSN